MYKCKKCEFQIDNVSGLANHYKYEHSNKEKFLCEKCNKSFKTKGGFKIHKRFCKGIIINHICPKCNNYIPNSIEKHIKSCGNKVSTGRTKGWSKGLTKENSLELKKVSDTLKLRFSNPDNIYKHTEKTKKLLSEILYKRYENGWEVRCGRCKKLDYHSDIAGDVKLDGGWELSVAKYLDSLNIKWTRNKRRFKYWNSIKNCESTYCPDFYVEDWNKYIEVKGYKTDLDEIKWKQFTEELEIWDKNKLKELGIKAKWL